MQCKQPKGTILLIKKNISIMDFKKIFIENESISGELQDAINNSLSREGYVSYIDKNGHMHYDHEEYNMQEEIYNTIKEDSSVQILLDSI